MSISEFAVRRWQFTLVVFVALVALGVQALLTIPKAEDPTFPFANFVVVAVLPGATPQDLERLVVDPIEAKLKALDDVKTLKSEMEDGLAVIQLEFKAGSDPDRKRDEVLRETTSLRPTLPADLVRLDVKQFNAAKVNIREVALVAKDVPFEALERLARGLKRRLENVRGAGDVEVAGLPKQEVQVALDLERMRALGVSPLEVLSAIGADGANVPAGSVEAGARRFTVKTGGDYRSVDEVRATLLRAPGSARLTLGDVAQVDLKDAEAVQLARFDGERAVLLAVAQRDNQNVFDVMGAIEGELDAFERTLPPNVRLARGFDQSKNVAHRLGGFSRDLLLAIVLVLVTLLPLGGRAAAVVMVSIPLSLALGLFLLKAAGFSINQLSIVGFVIALGLLVDDSVVVVENVTRHLRDGLSPTDAAIQATKQITVSVLGCTATLIFSFLPLLALPGTAGLFIRSMPVAVVFTIGASLLVSLTIVPFLSSLLLKRGSEHGNVFYRAMMWVVEGSYRRVLERAIVWPKTTLLVAALLVAGALALVPRIGFSLFPKAGTPQFLVTVEAPEGASLLETDRAARFVEEVLRRHESVKNVAVSVGKGHPQIYYNVVPANEKAHVADVFAETTLGTQAEREALFERLRGELAPFAGARIELKEFENGPPLEAPIAVRLLGDDQAQLEAAAALVEARVREVTGTRDVRNPSRDRRSDLRVKVDHERAAVLGVADPDVDRAVRLAVGGVVAAKYRRAEADEADDVRVTVPRAARGGPEGGARPGLEVFASLFVPTQKGAPVPLAELAELTFEPSPTRLRHYGKERSVTVTSQVAPGFNTDKLTREVLANVAAEKLPAGVRFAAGGELENRQESFGGLGTAIVVAIFGVLSILVLEFRTFKGTLIVASVIPLGVIGGLVALFLSGNTLSFTATVGFVALMGIEVKNSILLVDFTNHLREAGAPLDLAIRRAGETRFVPILLTTLTAIGGLLPLVLERSALYSPLALVILGGLVSSTLLARVVTPVLYKLLPPAVDAPAPRPAPIGAASPEPSAAE